MKIVLEIDNTPCKDDVLVFDGVAWHCIKKDVLFNDLTIQVNELKQELENLKKNVDIKLKEYHDVLKYIK